MLKYNGKKTIVTFGELLLRLAAPGHQKILQSKEFVATFCGAEANVAVSLANWGEKVKFVSAFPNNDIGKSALCDLRYFGVNVSSIALKGKRLGTYYLENGVSQRPSKVIYDREFSSFSLSQMADYDWNDIFSDACWFHFSGINPALSAEMETICLCACKEAKKRGVIVSCDLNYRSALWSKEQACKSMATLMPYVNVCIGNEEDAEKVLGIEVDGIDVEGGKLEQSLYESIAREITRRFNCEYVAFTLRTSLSASDNKWAAILYDSFKDESYMSKEYLIHIVDRVGGGDSFSAGLIYSLINHETNQDSIEFAVAASCLKHTIEGDYNRVSLDEIVNLLKTNGNGRVIR